MLNAKKLNSLMIYCLIIMAVAAAYGRTLSSHTVVGDKIPYG